MTDRAFKFLVLADESPEFPSALLFAALRAHATQGVLVILAVAPVEDSAGWASVDAEIRRQALQAAEALALRFAAEALAEAGVQAEVVVREGDQATEMRRLLAEDAGIRFVFLAAGAGAGGPGPLVTSLAKGMGGWTRPVPVVVVPGGLALAELRALAAPVAANPDSAHG